VLVVLDGIRLWDVDEGTVWNADDGCIAKMAASVSVKAKSVLVLVFLAMLMLMRCDAIQFDFLSMRCNALCYAVYYLC